MCNVRTLFKVICLIFVVIHTVESFDFSLNNSTRVKRDSRKKNCSKPDFGCKSGECIDGSKECDGAVDCEDASDESNACHRLKCPSYLFKCKYGACINKNLECDGKPDCRDASDENTPNCKKVVQETPPCKEDEFRCSSGQCIDKDDKCDGIAQCKDQSDELRETCWNVRCPGFTYKCKYGACVNGKAQCNGIVECLDGSDEDPNICKTSVSPTPPITPETPIQLPSGQKGSCILPPQPNFGSWSIYGFPSGSLQPGMPVDPGTILNVQCNKNHKLEGNNVLYCTEGQWSSNVGQCHKLCPARVSTATMTVTCIYQNKQVENCTEAVNGTLVKFQCAPFYEDLALKRKPTHICLDGDWDQPRPKCEPVCGQKTVEATQLIINGTKVNKGDYPWQVALYTSNDKELICGGSLISQKLILTAAHCVTDNKGTVYSKENYIVAVGKYYRSFNDTRDFNEAQFSELLSITVPERYKGVVQNFVGDIAILVTKKTFFLSRRVQPVCVDSSDNYNVVENQHGYVTGWGFTVENSAPSEVLKELKVPMVSLSTCQTNLPDDYEIYLTEDKFCAGYLDKSTSVCKGDSGGGLVFKHDGRYYITGIVSLSPTSPTSVLGCNSQQYGLYTKVSGYYDKYILPALAKFKT